MAKRVRFSQCDNFNEVHGLINDLYGEVASLQQAINIVGKRIAALEVAMAQPVEEPEKQTKKRKGD